MLVIVDEAVLACSDCRSVRWDLIYCVYLGFKKQRTRALEKRQIDHLILYVKISNDRRKKWTNFKFLTRIISHNKRLQGALVSGEAETWNHYNIRVIIVRYIHRVSDILIFHPLSASVHPLQSLNIKYLFHSKTGENDAYVIACITGRGLLLASFCVHPVTIWVQPSTFAFLVRWIFFCFETASWQAPEGLT